MNSVFANQRQRFYLVTHIALVVLALVIERVAGLPIIFLGMTIQSVELTDRRTRRLVLVAASLVLAIFYQVSFLATFLLVGVGELIWLGLSTVSSSKTARVLTSVVCMLVVFVMLQQLVVTTKMMVYSVLSFVILTASIRTNQQFTMRI